LHFKTFVKLSYFKNPGRTAKVLGGNDKKEIVQLYHFSVNADLGLCHKLTPYKN